MFDVAPTELLLVAAVALIVIGPKDLPKAMRFVGHWVGRARGVARQFRSGFDEMVREAEFAEMEKKWAEENARIMREHAPTAPALPAPDAEPAPPMLTEPPEIRADREAAEMREAASDGDAAAEPELPLPGPAPDAPRS